MKTKTFPVLYIMDCSCELMDKIRREINYWADGNENICMTTEQALEIDELKPMIGNFDGDIIVNSH